MQEDAPLITAIGVTRNFIKDAQAIEVLRGIDLEIHHGETLAITGASGVGKSTLIHILGALDKPTSGAVFYEGRDVFQMDDRGLARFRNQEIGFVFQFHHLLGELTALENVMMPSLISGSQRKRAASLAEEILKRLGMSERLGHKPGELSGGEQQRVAIARAVVLQPKVVLADEPTGNLDRRTGEGVEDMLLELNRDLKSTLLVVTHNPRLARKMGREVELVDGRIMKRSVGADGDGEG
jgi:lipoprotein-releasing system ATP-binding protein